MGGAFGSALLGIGEPPSASPTLEILRIIEKINKIRAGSILAWNLTLTYFWRDAEVNSRSEFLRLIAFAFRDNGCVEGTEVIDGGVDTDAPSSPAARSDSSNEPVLRSD